MEEKNQKIKEKKTRIEKFISDVIERLNKDTGFGAAMRRADNPDTEYQAWEYLARWCNLEKDYERRPFAIVASAIGRAKPKIDGKFSIGEALSEICRQEGSSESAVTTKMRRLLACTDILEVCNVLRPILNYIISKSLQSGLCFNRLLNDLVFFNPNKTRARWASDFYRNLRMEK